MRIYLSIIKQTSHFTAKLHHHLYQTAHFVIDQFWDKKGLQLNPLFLRPACSFHDLISDYPLHTSKLPKIIQDFAHFNSYYCSLVIAYFLRPDCSFNPKTMETKEDYNEDPTAHLSLY